MIENDRQRVIVEKGKKVNLVDIGNSFLPPFEKITSVLVVPFTADGLIVCALLPRGIDLPGGHTQKNEQNCEETARREAIEEAGITLGKLQLLTVLQSDYLGSETEQLTYIVVMTGFVENILPYEGLHESLGRRIIRIDDFLTQYQNDDFKENMCKIVQKAKNLLLVKPE